MLVSCLTARYEFRHEESGDIFESVAAEAIYHRKNIILDATLKNTDKAKRKIAALRKAGYRVKVYATNIEAAISVQRAVDRFKKKGRYVPIEYAALNNEAINQSVRDVATYGDEYRVWDTSSNPPQVILEGSSSSLTR